MIARGDGGGAGKRAGLRDGHQQDVVTVHVEGGRGEDDRIIDDLFSRDLDLRTRTPRPCEDPTKHARPVGFRERRIPIIVLRRTRLPAYPIEAVLERVRDGVEECVDGHWIAIFAVKPRICRMRSDRKSTRLNSSHSQISYAVFCLKKK